MKTTHAIIILVAWALIFVAIGGPEDIREALDAQYCQNVSVESRWTAVNEMEEQGERVAANSVGYYLRGK